MGLIREEFGVALSIRTVFDTDTVEGLAAMLSGVESTPDAARAPAQGPASGDLLARLGDMSEEEVDRLLREFGEA